MSAPPNVASVRKNRIRMVTKKSFFVDLGYRLDGEGGAWFVWGVGCVASVSAWGWMINGS